jgi:hypothetical protein
MSEPWARHVRKILVAASVVAVLAAEAARADAPTTTAGGEIARGVDAASACGSQLWSSETYPDCIDRVIAQAMDQDKDSPSFDAGVYCSAFFNSALAYRAWTRSQSTRKAPQSDGDLLQATTLDEYESCLFAAHGAHLAIRQICSAIGLNCAEFNNMLRRWKAIDRKAG